MAGAVATFLLGGAMTVAQAADSPYKGKTIRFLSSSNVHQEAFADKIKEIGKAWGMNVEVRLVTTDELQKKVVLDFVGKADTWDLVYTGGVQRTFEWFDGGIIDDLAPLMEKYGDKKLLDWDEFSESARSAVTFDKHILGIAMATSDQALAYRKDLFDNAEEKAAFKAKHGYELTPPVTYNNTMTSPNSLPARKARNWPDRRWKTTSTESSIPTRRAPSFGMTTRTN
jgi:multiple sugar transport system substrate-binding protein